MKKKNYKIPTSKHMSRFRGNMKNISYKNKIDIKTLQQINHFLPTFEVKV
jgi:hypothetical protein